VTALARLEAACGAAVAVREDHGLRPAAMRTVPGACAWVADGPARALALRGFGLTSLPQALADLPALRHLDLAGNAIAELPDGVRALHARGAVVATRRPAGDRLAAGARGGAARPRKGTPPTPCMRQTLKRSDDL
jgi:hypothetical protein